jgi:aryl-alcohol dehydrogenase-like predicted oxidoreductase
VATSATAAGTGSYRDRFRDRLPAAHFRTLDGIGVSSIGLGTYLGEEDDEADRAYAEAVASAVTLGCNLFDAAINYRAQRSERVLGHTLAALMRQGRIARDQVVVCSKGGYIPFDGYMPPAPDAYFRDTYVRPGIVEPADVVAGCHVMTPRYLADQIGRSLRNLALETIDVYYLHNPETQLGAVPRAEFLHRVQAAFALFEHEVGAGRLARYGVATWNGLRQPPEVPDHLSLGELVRAAEAVGGGAHHFKVIQLPHNLAMPEAYTEATQLLDGERVTVLEAARRLGVAVVASASILQGQLSVRLPQVVADVFPGLTTTAQRALQFVRSTPGITTALVGMGRRAHAEENLAVAAVEPAPAGVDSLFTRR